MALIESAGLELIVETELPFAAEDLERRASWLLDQLDCAERAVTLVLVDDASIRTYNRDWRSTDASTDVLSFPLQEGFGVEFSGGMLGDVMISVETAVRLATQGDHPQRVSQELGREVRWGVLDEVTFLFVHGLLHLLGYDHAESDEEREMREREAALMRGFLDHAEAQGTGL